MTEHTPINDYTDRFMVGGKFEHVSHYRKIVTVSGQVFEVGEEPEHYPGEVDQIQEKTVTDIAGNGGSKLYLVSFVDDDLPPVELMNVAHGQLRNSPLQEDGGEN